MAKGAPGSHRRTGSRRRTGKGGFGKADDSAGVRSGRLRRGSVGLARRELHLGVNQSGTESYQESVKSALAYFCQYVPGVFFLSLILIYSG